MYLDLKDGQTLRLLPITKTDIFFKTTSYKFGEYRFTYESVDFYKNNRTNINNIRYHFLVEYEGKLKFIRTGFRIYNKIKNYVDEMYKLNNNLGFYDFSINLNIKISQVDIYPSYDNTYLSIGKLSNIDVEEFYKSIKYLNAISWFNTFSEKIKLINNPNAILFLDKLGIMPSECLYVIRKIKINKIKKNRSFIKKLHCGENE